MRIFQWRDKSKRALNTIITTAFLATQIIVPISVFSHASADSAGNNPATDVHKVTICHRTDDVQKPYVSITVDASAINGDGRDDHSSHTGPVATSQAVAQTIKDSQGKWGDIIPPFYSDGSTSSVTWDSYNWTPDGQAVYNNGCSYVTPITPLSPTVSVPTCANPNEVVSLLAQTGVVWTPSTSTTLVPGATVTYTAAASSPSYVIATGAQTSFSFTNHFDVTTCPPAQPTVNVTRTACTLNTNSTDTLNVEVTNTADITQSAVTYTVVVKNGSVIVATQSLPALADGASGALHFSGLAAGTYTVVVTGSDQTSVTSDGVTVNPCPYLPAAPTAVASIVPCELFSGLNDTINVVVTNTADNTHQTVTYTVSLGGQTKYITLADGAHGTVSFDSLNIGTYSATVTGNDGTGPLTTNQVTVGSCPRPVPTAQLRVIKKLVPSTDSGRFNLKIDGSVKASAVGDDGTTGYVTVSTGTHTVSETAGNDSTSLSNYRSSYRCYNDENNDENDDTHVNVLGLFTNSDHLESQSGNGTSFNGLVLHNGDKVTCVFTNTLIPHPAIRVVKDGPATAYEGDNVTYTFKVTNTGNTSLSFPQVNDNVVGKGVYVSGDTNHNNRLDVGETWLYTKSYVIPAHSNDITNTVTACAWDTHEDKVCDTDHHTTHVYHPYITVTKHVVTSLGSDNGVFNLNIDSTVKATGGNNTTTGSVLVTPGTHTVSETGADGTVLGDYDSQIRCWVGEVYVGVPNDTTLHNVTVTGDQHAYCVITNTRHTAHLTIVKDAVPNDPQPFNFTLSKQNACEELTSELLPQINEESSQCDNYSNVDSFQLVDNTDPTLATKTEAIATGTYKLTEADTTGWDLTGLTCTGADTTTVDGSSVTLSIQTGQNVTCTYTNTKEASVTIVKDAQPDSSQMFNFTTTLGGSFSLMDDGTNTRAASTSFTNVKPGTYTVTEAATGGWKLASVSCGTGVETSLSGGTLTVTVSPGANLTCTFTNTKIVGEVLGLFTTATPGMGGGAGASAVAPAELVNTGQSVWAYVIAGLAIIAAAVGLSQASRKQQLN